MCLVVVYLSVFGMVVLVDFVYVCCFFFKQRTAYEMRISDWSSDVCSSDLILLLQLPVMLLFLVTSYVVLKSVDSRIGVEGFGDLFGYALNGVRITLIDRKSVV